MARKVIAFCGNQGSGKSFSTERLVKTMGYKSVAYADALRDIAFSIIGIPYEEGMEKYSELKKTDLINGLTFRNILENLGSGVRKYDKDFWARTVIVFIENVIGNVCISDLRYYNEYKVIKDYCDEKEIQFSLVFCDYRSPDYSNENPHESAKLARYLTSLGYKDQEYVRDIDMERFRELRELGEI